MIRVEVVLLPVNPLKHFCFRVVGLASLVNVFALCFEYQVADWVVDWKLIQ